MIKVVESAYTGHKEIDAALRLKSKECFKDDPECVAPGTRSKLDFIGDRLSVKLCSSVSKAKIWG